MKRVFLIFAALAAWTAAAQSRTATENFVTNKIAVLATNVYTKSETDARIVELSPPTSLAPATNYTDKATNAIPRIAAGESAPGAAERADSAAEADYAYSAANAENAETSQRAVRANVAFALGDEIDAIDRRYTGDIFRQLDAATTTNDVCNIVTNIVRDLSLGGIWDETLQVWWTPRMKNGSLTYEATTNVNLNAEN